MLFSYTGSITELSRSIYACDGGGGEGGSRTVGPLAPKNGKGKGKGVGKRELGSERGKKKMEQQQRSKEENLFY